MKILKSIGKIGWALLMASVGFIVLQVWLDLKSPEYMQEITVLVQTNGSQMSDILWAGGKMLLCCLGSFASSVIVAIFASKISADFSADLRARIHGKVQSFSMAEMSKFSTASLITRSTNDVTQLQMVIVVGLQVIIKAPIMAIWAICKISNSAWQWTLSVGVAIALIAVVMLVCLLIAMPKFKKLQRLTDDLNRVTRENLTGIKVVRAYNAEDYQEKKFAGANDELANTQLFANRTMAFMMPSIQFVMNGISLVIYLLGAIIINNMSGDNPLQLMQDKLTLFSQMVTFSTYAMQIIIAFMMLVMVFMILPRALVSVRRINEVLDTNPSISDGSLETSPDGVQGEIEFKNVSFAYPDAEETVVENISFSAKKGETVALIGATGCGKSTVVNLIPRFYDATSGEVLVDGVNVKEYTQKALRSKISYISQKAILFSGDIKSNVGYGESEISDEDIASAIEISQSAEFVGDLEDGVSSFVAQGGTNFSGGQKQRLSIARGLARNAEIIIFDDTFSALDYATDRKLRSALKEKCGDATKIIVAQRIGTIRDADKIIVLEDGKIAGMGKHSELMQNCEVYKQIALSQLSQKEAA